MSRHEETQHAVILVAFQVINDCNHRKGLQAAHVPYLVQCWGMPPPDPVDFSPFEVAESLMHWAPGGVLQIQNRVAYTARRAQQLVCHLHYIISKVPCLSWL